MTGATVVMASTNDSLAKRARFIKTISTDPDPRKHPVITPEFGSGGPAAAIPSLSTRSDDQSLRSGPRARFNCATAFGGGSYIYLWRLCMTVLQDKFRAHGGGDLEGRDRGGRIRTRTP